jgi:hypothetical protein
MLRTLVALAAAGAFAAAIAATPPASVKAEYAVYKDGLHIAIMQESYDTNDAKYQITSDSNPVGLLALFVHTKIKAQSAGTVTAAGLQPERMNYGRLDDASKNVSAAFDWRARELHLTFDGRGEILPLGSGTQDRVSVMYQFMFLSPEKLKLLEFPMTNGKKIEHYRYELTGHEQIDTPVGKLDTLHLVKQRERDENGIEVWLAADRHLFPVKVLFRENDGSRIEQVITRLEFKSPGH